MRADKQIFTKLSRIEAEIFWHKYTKFGWKIFTLSKDMAIWPKSSIFKVNNAVETHNNGLRHLFDKISNQFYKSYVLQVYRQKRNVFHVYFVAGDTKHLFYSIAYAFPLIKMRSEYWKSLKFAPEQLVTCNKTHFTILCNKVCIVGIAFVLINLRNIILVKLVADFVKKMT